MWLTLVAIVLGEKLMGIPGMILSVPMMVILKITADNVPSLKFMSALLSK